MMFNSASRARPFLASLMAVTLLAWSAAAHAVEGPYFKLPIGPKYKSGLTLYVDGRGIDAIGYRPIRVTVATWPVGKPVKADRQVRVVLGCYSQDYRRVHSVSQVIELPEGSASV